MTGCGKNPSTTQTPVLSQPPQTTYPMPPVKSVNSDMGWTVANTQHVRLSDYKDKVVVLDFYATWCEPCRAAIPRLVDLQKRYGAQGLQIVGLNVGGPDDPENVPQFAREFHIQYQLGIPDPELESLYLGNSNAIPQTVVLARAGTMQRKFEGYDESMDQELETSIRALLTESK